MPNFYSEGYMKQGLADKGHSLGRSQGSLYGNKEELYDRLKRHAYQPNQGKKGEHSDQNISYPVLDMIISLSPQRRAVQTRPRVTQTTPGSKLVTSSRDKLSTIGDDLEKSQLNLGNLRRSKKHYSLQQMSTSK